MNGRRGKIGLLRELKSKSLRGIEGSSTGSVSRVLNWTCKFTTKHLETRGVCWTDSPLKYWSSSTV